MSQPRHKRKRSLLQHNGEQVHVTRQLATGEVVEYDAIFEIEVNNRGELGQALLERINFLHACARVGAWAMFHVALDLPVKGLPEWWMISGHYVRMNRHTQGRTYTRAVMDLR
jgi:hypothetical protein